MEQNGNVQVKSYVFALEVVKLCRRIQRVDREFVLTTQFLKSATSVGANLEEAVGSQSDKDLLAKLFISYKEARESRYWLRLMFDAEMILLSEKKLLDDKCL